MSLGLSGGIEGYESQVLVKGGDKPVARGRFQPRIPRHLALALLIEFPYFSLEGRREAKGIEAARFERGAFGGRYFPRRRLHLAVDDNQRRFSREKAEAGESLHLLRRHLHQSQRPALLKPLDDLFEGGFFEVAGAAVLLYPFHPPFRLVEIGKDQLPFYSLDRLREVAVHPGELRHHDKQGIEVADQIGRASCRERV